jgi:hypothetical protein
MGGRGDGEGREGKVNVVGRNTLSFNSRVIRLRVHGGMNTLSFVHLYTVYPPPPAPSLCLRLCLCLSPSSSLTYFRE